MRSRLLVKQLEVREEILLYSGCHHELHVDLEVFVSVQRMYLLAGQLGLGAIKCMFKIAVLVNLGALLSTRCQKCGSQTKLLPFDV